MANSKNPKNPGTNRIREALSRIYDGQTPYFREYLRRYQEDPKSRVFAPLAEAYRRSGKLEEAIQICLEGLKHHPEFAGGRVALAKCYFDKKEYAACRDELERVVEKIPENLLAQRLLGDVQSALGNYTAALEAYKIALVLAPGDAKLAQRIQQLEKEQFDTFTESIELVQGSPEGEPGENIPIAASMAGSGSEEGGPPPIEPPLQDLIPMIADDGHIELVPVGEEHNFESVENLLGGEEDEADEDAFQVEAIPDLFEDEKKDSEINTETLGDLYFAQGQFERCLKIFEKIQRERNSPDLVKKIDAARARLGVGDGIGSESGKKIELLKGILDRLHENKADEASMD